MGSKADIQLTLLVIIDDRIDEVHHGLGGFNIVVGSTQLKPRLAGNFAW
jgi:hypothetical protein